jgi:hypothetical protein
VKTTGQTPIRGPVLNPFDDRFLPENFNISPGFRPGKSQVKQKKEPGPGHPKWSRMMTQKYRWIKRTFGKSVPTYEVFRTALEEKLMNLKTKTHFYLAFRFMKNKILLMTPEAKEQFIRAEYNEMLGNFDGEILLSVNNFLRRVKG